MTTSPAFSTAFAKEAFNVEALPQVWVIEQQPGADWTAETYGERAWASEPQSDISWTREIFVPTLTNLYRVTEFDAVNSVTGFLRLTEQDVVRVTQRAYVDPWIRETRPGAVWSRDHA